ncbi:MAG: hypothetical protein ACI4VT_02295 [Bacilli bacterium]
MKNRKKMITTALIVLVLLLGVGYATVSSVSLNINGTSKAETKELQVFYDGTNSGTSAKVTAISSPANTRTATFTVENMTLNETVTMTFEVKNYEKDVNATLAAPNVTENTKPEYFQVTTSCDKTTLNAGDTATITVNVKLIKTPVSEEAGSTTVTVEMAASPVA